MPNDMQFLLLTNKYVVSYHKLATIFKNGMTKNYETITKYFLIQNEWLSP